MKLAGRKIGRGVGAFLIFFLPMTYFAAQIILPVPRVVLDQCGRQAWFGHSPDGKLLFTSDISDWDAHYLEAVTPIHVWSSETGKLLGSLGAAPYDKNYGNIWIMTCSPDGRHLAWQGQDSTIHVHSLQDFTERLTLEKAGETRFSFSPDGRYFDLCVGTEFHRCDLENPRSKLGWTNKPMESGHVMGSIGFYREPLANFFYSPTIHYSTDGSHVMVKRTGEALESTADFERHLIFDVRNTPKLVKVQSKGERWSLSPDGRTMSVEREGGPEPIDIASWSVASGRFLITGAPPLKDKLNPSIEIHHSKDAHIVTEHATFRNASSSGAFGFTLWDASSKPLRPMGEFPDPWQFKILSDGRVLVLHNTSMSQERIPLSIDNVKTGESRIMGDLQGSGFHRLLATPDDQLFVVGHTCRDKSGDIGQYWNRTLDKLGSLTGATFERLRVKPASSPISETRSTESGEVLAALKDHFPMKILPDGKTLVTQGSDYSISLWSFHPSRDWLKAMMISALPSLFGSWLLLLVVAGVRRIYSWRLTSPIA